jgi:hypothetical protein
MCATILLITLLIEIVVYCCLKSNALTTSTS